MQRRTFRTFYDNQFNNAIETKRNLAEVESMLTSYQRNNRCLVDQVHELIKENQTLKKATARDSQSVSMRRSALIDVNRYLQKSRKTPTNHSKSKSPSRLNHPRNAYLSRQEIENMNLKEFGRARTAQKKYDNQRGFDKFKQELKEKKKKASQNVSEGNSLYKFSMSRNVYLQQPSLSYHEPKTVQRLNLNKNKHCENNEILETSPFDRLKQQIQYTSPDKSANNTTAPNQRKRAKSKQDGSPFKISDVYSNSNIKLEKPSTQWKDVTNSYLGNLTSHKLTNRQKQQKNHQQPIKQQQTFRKDSNKHNKKKFLNVISGFCKK